MLKGKRTYITLAAIVAITLASLVETGGSALMSPDVTAAVVVILGAVGAFFRRAA